MPGGRPRILFVCGYEPTPITVRKMEALAETGEWDLHLAFSQTPPWGNPRPFTAPAPVSVHSIDTFAAHGPADGAGRAEPPRGPGGGPGADAPPAGRDVGSRHLELPAFQMRLARLVHAIRPRVIHASNSNMLPGAWLHTITSPSRALVYDMLNTDAGMRRRPVASIQRILHRRVDRLTVPSPRCVTGFLDPLGLRPPGTEPMYIANTPWRRTFAGLAPRQDAAFAVGYVGSFRCAEAINWLIASARRARAAGASIELVLAGTGVARARVEEAARRDSFITYTGAYDYDADIRAISARLDAVYAVYDTSADKRTHLACRLSDAIAANRAIIAARGTYMGEIVEEGRLGYTVDLDRPDTLDAALVDAARRRAEWRRTDQVPAALCDDHVFDRCVPRLCEIYREALRMRAVAGPVAHA